jgi:hypothetical protein
MDIFLVVFLAWRNSLRARLKGQNSAVWVLITIFTYYFFEVIGFFAVFAFFYKGQPTPEGVMSFVKNLPTSTVVFIMVCGIGGYLLIRYILERMTNKIELPPNDQE